MLQNPFIINEKQYLPFYSSYFSLKAPYIDYTFSSFYKKIFIPISMIFQKPQPSYK